MFNNPTWQHKTLQALPFRICQLGHAKVCTAHTLLLEALLVALPLLLQEVDITIDQACWVQDLKSVSRAFEQTEGA